MYSKSSRDSTKSSSQKQTSNIESSKKSSQHSKRYRRSSSSSESSDRDKVHKTTHTSISKNSSPEVEKISEILETSKSSKTNDNIKHLLEKSLHSSSSRQNHKKSRGHSDEDSRSSSRKSRHGGHSHERSRDDKNEDKDDMTNKGKSKSKHRSKSEKQPQIQDVQTKNESEISENVQVTPQSPQASIDILVDNDTERDENESNVPRHEISDVTPQPSGESSIKRCSTSNSNDSNEHQQPKQSDSDEPSQVIEDGMVASEGGTEAGVYTIEWQPMLEVLPMQGDTEILDYQEEVLQGEANIAEGSSNGTTEVMGPGEFRSKSSSPDAGMTSQIADQQCASSRVTADDSSNAGGAHLQSDEDSRSVDAIILHEGSNTPPRDGKFNLSESYSSDIHSVDNINNEIQSMKNKIGELFATPPKPKRKHMWGNTLAGLELIKPSMKNITIDTIKEFCPNVAFLEENEIRLAAEQREKKVDRRVSMDYKSDEESSRRYDTQSSHEEINSETDNSNIIALNRKISIVEDTASKLRPPPSPARNPVSSILYISNLVRPFTLKHLKELLERTGRIRENGFWTDRIKSKCYVRYENAEYAEATRNALHGVNWPIGNGKQLMIEYSTPEEFEKAKNPAPTPAALEKPANTARENIDTEKQVSNKRPRHEEPERVPKEKERHRSEAYGRERDTHKDTTRIRRSRSRRPSRSREARREPSRDRIDRRRSRRTVTPPDYRSRKQKMKEEEPQKLMDDLFQKTKSVPSVYWLPLTPEEIATKQQERLLRMAEHKRRMEESSRIRGDYGRGAPYRRRYD